MYYSIIRTMIDTVIRMKVKKFVENTHKCRVNGHRDLLYGNMLKGKPKI